ncbi:MAG TPA: GNAT family N-acetyltransferase [Propionibacteriaceae bacterium]|nr:GNAT family N-acetyltransferase [Propionibacteriaceae bacterium]
MPFVRVEPGDREAIQSITDIINAARPVDDPDSFPAIAELVAADVEFGWDMNPASHFLYTPSDGDAPVGMLVLEMPKHDNLQLVWTWITVHPDHRRRGHGTTIMNEALRQARDAGRGIIWVGVAEDDIGGQSFVDRFGFRYASHDARRRQRLAEVDYADIDRLYAQAVEAASDYRIERLTPPVSDEVLAELVEVTAAINDAPAGTLTYEDEVFNTARLRDIETAREKRGDILYRVVARHRSTGKVGGHTQVVFNPLEPNLGHIGDTAVARDHRGHRLGLLLKIDMMRWLADEQPQLETLETWNNVDNRYMINVNEAIGYRLSRVFNTYELKLEEAVGYGANQKVVQTAVS